MNVPEARDNSRFALNLLHWLTEGAGGRPARGVDARTRIRMTQNEHVVEACIDGFRRPIAPDPVESDR